MEKTAGGTGALMARYLPMAGAVLLAVFNGSLYSPAYDPADQLLYLFSRTSLHAGPLPLPERTTVFIAAMTLLIGGIPAALYERMRGMQHSGAKSTLIWMLGTLLLTLPALLEVVWAD